MVIAQMLKSKVQHTHEWSQSLRIHHLCAILYDKLTFEYYMRCLCIDEAWIYIIYGMRVYGY